MHHLVEAYLDIETTGLSPWDSEITVVGIHLCNGDDTKFIQLVGKDISAQSILEALNGLTYPSLTADWELSLKKHLPTVT